MSAAKRSGGGPAARETATYNRASLTPEQTAARNAWVNERLTPAQRENHLASSKVRKKLEEEYDNMMESKLPASVGDSRTISGKERTISGKEREAAGAVSKKLFPTKDAVLAKIPSISDYISDGLNETEAVNLHTRLRSQALAELESVYRLNAVEPPHDVINDNFDVSTALQQARDVLKVERKKAGLNDLPPIPESRMSEAAPDSTPDPIPPPVEAKPTQAEGAEVLFRPPEAPAPTEAAPTEAAPSQGQVASNLFRGSDFVDPINARLHPTFDLATIPGNKGPYDPATPTRPGDVPLVSTNPEFQAVPRDVLNGTTKTVGDYLHDRQIADQELTWKHNDAVTRNQAAQKLFEANNNAVNAENMEELLQRGRVEIQNSRNTGLNEVEKVRQQGARDVAGKNAEAQQNVAKTRANADTYDKQQVLSLEQKEKDLSNLISTFQERISTMPHSEAEKAIAEFDKIIANANQAVSSYTTANEQNHGYHDRAIRDLRHWLSRPALTADQVAARDAESARIAAAEAQRQAAQPAAPEVTPVETSPTESANDPYATARQLWRDGHWAASAADRTAVAARNMFTLKNILKGGLGLAGTGAAVGTGYLLRGDPTQPQPQPQPAADGQDAPPPASTPEQIAPLFSVPVERPAQKVNGEEASFYPESYRSEAGAREAAANRQVEHMTNRAGQSINNADKAIQGVAKAPEAQVVTQSSNKSSTDGLTNNLQQSNQDVHAFGGTVSPEAQDASLRALNDAGGYERQQQAQLDIFRNDPVLQQLEQRRNELNNMAPNWLFGETAPHARALAQLEQQYAHRVNMLTAAVGSANSRYGATLPGINTVTGMFSAGSGADLGTSRQFGNVSNNGDYSQNTQSSTNGTQTNKTNGLDAAKMRAGLYTGIANKDLDQQTNHENAASQLNTQLAMYARASRDPRFAELVDAWGKATETAVAERQRIWQEIASYLKIPEQKTKTKTAAPAARAAIQNSSK